MKKEQSAKLLKEIEKFNFIKYNDLLSIGLITTQFLHVFFRKSFVHYVPSTILR